jgi:hypothetical protein
MLEMTAAGAGGGNREKMCCTTNDVREFGFLIFVQAI